MEREMTLVRAEIIKGSPEVEEPEPEPTEHIQEEIRIDQAWERYFSSKTRPDTSDATLKQYRFQFQCFIEWLKNNHPEAQLISDVTEQIAWNFLSYLAQEKNLSANTYNKYINLQTLVFRVLGKETDSKHNPWESAGKRKVKPASRRPFSEDELKKIFEMADGEILTLCLLGFHTALRFGDCCLLRWDEVDLDGRLITRTPLKTANSSGKTVVIPIHDELHDHLVSMKSDGKKYVCPKMAKGYSQDRTGVSIKLQKFFKKCGIKLYREGTGVIGEDGKHIRAVPVVGFHSFRHTWVSTMAERGVDAASIRSIVGWGSPAMERIYTHVSQAHLKAAINQGRSVMGRQKKKTEPDEPAANSNFAKLASSLGDEQLKNLLNQILDELRKRNSDMPSAAEA